MRSNALAIFSGDSWKLSIPAILYVIQNNLQFVAASHLDVATFSVTYQLKILTTALCSVIILKRRLTSIKWLSLLFLAIGVALVQVQTTPSQTKTEENRTIGFIAVAAACFTSGLAGVYFELVLKSSAKVDLWIRNVQLSIFSLIPALITILATTSSHDDKNQAAPSWFQNFGWWAWATVLTQVLGGLLTALVIKFADNILKGFATSLSIILSTLAGVCLFDLPLNSGMVLGGSLVLISTYFYNYQPKPTTTKQSEFSAHHSTTIDINHHHEKSSKPRPPDLDLTLTLSATKDLQQPNSSNKRFFPLTSPHSRIPSKENPHA